MNLLPRLALLCLTFAAAAIGQSRESSGRVEFLPAYTELTVLTAETPSVERELLVDSAEAVDLSFSSSSENVDLILTDPTGATYRAGGPAANGVTSLILEAPEEATVHSFRLSSPMPGRWTYRVGSPVQPTAIILTMSSSSTLAAGLLGLGTYSPAGQDVQAGLVIFDAAGGLPSSAVTSIEASLARDGGAPESLAFVDEGAGLDAAADDGVFTANITPDQPGEYSVYVRIEGVRNGTPFARTAAGRFVATEPCGRFLGPFRSFAVDDDANGLDDGLELEAEIEALRSGRFHLQAALRASNDETDFANGWADLDAGEQTVRVGFDAARLRALGAPGPYQVTDLKLAFLNEGGLETCATWIEVGETEAFDPASAEREPILVVGPHGDSATDDDSDGTLDRLDFRVGLDLTSPGDYTWSAGLYDAAGSQIDFADGAGALTVGQTSAGLAFDGGRIAANGADGPYEVRNFSILGDAATAAAAFVGRTGPYAAEDFGAITGGPGPGGAAPRIAAGGVVHAASFGEEFSPGSWVTIFGENLSKTTAVWDNAIVGDQLPTELAGVRVTINGRPAAIAFVSPSQLNVQAPDDSAVADVDVGVSVDGVPSEPRQGRLSVLTPGFFTVKPGRVAYAAAVHLDGTFVGPSDLFSGNPAARPAKPGDRILIFGTGFGPTDPPTPAGKLFQGAAPLAFPSSVFIGGRPAQIEFAGLSGAGLNQFNVIVPEGLPSGDRFLLATVGTGATPPGVRLFIGDASDGRALNVSLVSATSSVASGGLINHNWTASFRDSRPKTLLIEAVLSTDQTLDDNDAVLGSETRQTEQGVSGSGSSGSVTVPSSTPPGDYFFGIVVTLGGADGTPYRSNVLPVRVTP